MVLSATKKAADDGGASEKAKERGNACFKAKDFDGAVEAYGEALRHAPTNHLLFSNRAAAHLGRGALEDALSDAEACVRLEPTFLKGWFRLYTACSKLGKWERACAAIEAGSKHEAGGGKKDVFTSALRKRAAEAAHVAAAEAALARGDVAEAERRIKQGQRVDFRNAALGALARRAADAQRRAEEAARAGMSPAELAKQDGNALFRESQYEAAIDKYSEALRLAGEVEPEGAGELPPAASELAIACYNNRAACYQQVSDFERVVRDTTRVLGAAGHGANAKALLRRALALEALERFEAGLADARALLLVNPRMDAANSLKNRLQSAMRRAKDLRACERG